MSKRSLKGSWENNDYEWPKQAYFGLTRSLNNHLGFELAKIA